MGSKSISLETNGVRASQGQQPWGWPAVLDVEAPRVPASSTVLQRVSSNLPVGSLGSRLEASSGPRLRYLKDRLFTGHANKQ